jgi:hypothetical protein
MVDRGSVSHDFGEESEEAKARWFSGLTLSERMDLFVAFTDLILENNPGIVDKKDAQPVERRVRVLAKA